MVNSREYDRGVEEKYKPVAMLRSADGILEKFPSIGRRTIVADGPGVISRRSQRRIKTGLQAPYGEKSTDEMAWVLPLCIRK